MVRPRG